jgi:glycosyltransferase involved in cell wall biosynthesis
MGGSALSCVQILSGIAHEGYTVTAIAPVTPETLKEGERFSSDHPELKTLRYILPEYDNGPCRSDLVQTEQESVCQLFQESFKSFGPNLVISGRESFARHVPALGASFNLPVIQWIRGGPYSEYSYWTGTEDGQSMIAGLRKADRIITVAEHLTRDLYRLGFDNAKTIPNAVDLGAFSVGCRKRRFRQELQIGKDQAVVLVPGNIIPRKRPYDILTSAATAIERNPSMLYIMAGAGWLRSEVIQACQESGLMDSFRFPGWVNYDDMPDLFNIADIVMMASEAEGLARSYIEAMACERLLIASDIPAAREVIVHGKNGLLFPVGDTQQLTDLTVKAVEDESWRTRLGKEAKRSVKHRSLALAVKEYVREIETLLAACG